jgi:hypothetical protein
MASNPHTTFVFQTDRLEEVAKVKQKAVSNWWAASAFSMYKKDYGLF